MSMVETMNGSSSSSSSSSTNSGSFSKKGLLPSLTEDPQSWSNSPLISAEQITREGLNLVLSVADQMKIKVAKNGGDRSVLEGKLLGTIFYEPSTRTCTSFQAAAQRLGAGVVAVNEATSSTQKGETLSDTIKCLASYCDAIVLRHPVKGSAAIAAGATTKPVLNAGDGIGEHPTQSLLDLFTIKDELGEVAGKNITMVGDLKHGRTVHSLARLLCHFPGVSITYVSPASLAIPDDIKSYVAGRGVTQAESFSLDDDILASTDVLYVTRVQKERFAKTENYEAVKDALTVTSKTLEKCKEHMIIMHPLPRVNEIHVDVDSDPRAAYFREMENGMFVRMALLALIMGKPQSWRP